MLITDLRETERNGWLELAREFEPLFGAPMAGQPEFHQFVDRKIADHEALGAIKRRPSPRLAAVIALSKNHNRISWFGVGDGHRRRGIGSALLRCAIAQLDNERDIEVITFTADQPGGTAARSLFTKHGFVEAASDLEHHGMPRSLFVLKADEGRPTGGSFHYKLGRYRTWESKDECPVCRDEPETPGYVTIKELEHSWLGANSSAQGTLWGKCSVLAKKHATELHDFAPEDLTGFMSDVQSATRALKAVSRAVKINCEIHGNTLPHLHAHLFPRYLDDPFPSAPIDYRISDPSPYEDGEFDYFVSAMRRELES